MESFDVIIVGGGPAGLSCAETLGDSGYSVLLLEKNKEIGPKVCAGGLTRKGMRLLSLPEELVEFSFDKVSLHVNNSCTEVRQKEDFIFTIDRKRLGQWQLEKLKKFRNVDVRTGAEVTGITKEHVIAGGRRISYRFLVGADGSSSAVRRYLGLDSRTTGLGVQYVIPTEEYENLEIFFEPKAFSAWYAWIFPHRGCASVGCGCDPNDMQPGIMMKNFRAWLKRRGIDVSKAELKGFVINCDYQGNRFGNVFLAGDAGGFASEMTGEGIYQALVSGEETGRMILDPKHEPQRIEALLKTKKRHRQLKNTLARLGRFRTVMFYAGLLLFRVPFLRRLAIEQLG